MRVTHSYLGIVTVLSLIVYFNGFYGSMFTGVNNSSNRNMQTSLGALDKMQTLALVLFRINACLLVINSISGFINIPYE